MKMREKNDLVKSRGGEREVGENARNLTDL